ncbi:Putative DNA-binding domain-containing protein [Nonlabens sp. Hel1_33_55]|uniref:ATP-binding protein n=1 Tax=Nonlabens sp. Hel1_33_55 TaxID=1336802 RepID=UPI000875B5C3|nr:ATP-binding protein [Nonlabens sp. Hel1_33_55]SCY29736.1 Putative DNA-binding domain-containing protein [Nonlabens sp. Hel1_33_55]
MINKRLLVKNLLAHNDENSFYDKKLRVDLSNKEGKAKFLKHICALSNSNPANNSYIVVGVDDRKNEIVGVDFFDDSKLQNLINAYLDNAPLVMYENVPFPHLPIDKVVGLVTIRAQNGIVALRKNIWKYYGGAVFFRDGSISMPKDFGIRTDDVNSPIVNEIEKNASNNIELTLDRVQDFMNRRENGLESFYKVFKEQFVICWSGKVKRKKNQEYYYRVDIEMVNEQVRLFYSALDEVQISYDEDSFSILEFVELGLGDRHAYHPLERQTFRFFPNGTYKLENKILFNPPFYDRRTLHHIYNANLSLLHRISNGIKLKEQALIDLRNLPETMLICHFNNVGEPIEKMKAARTHLKNFPDTYKAYKESLRILRKVKYNS